MKQNLRNVHFIIISFLLLIYGCQTEDSIIDAKAHGEIISKKITLEEMSRYSGAVGKINPFIRKKNDNSNKKIVYDEKYGFWVDTDQILMMQQDEHITFTIPVFRDFTNGKTENLVLNLKDNGGYSVMLFKYDFTEQDKLDIRNNLSILNLDTKTEVELLTNEETQTYTSMGGGTYEGIIFQGQDGRCYRINHITQIGPVEWKITFVPVNCPEQYASSSYTEDGSGGGSGGASPVWYPIPTSGNGGDGPVVGSNGGGTGPSGDDGPEPEPIITTPIIIEAPNIPCVDLVAKDQNEELQEKLIDLKSKAATQTVESAYALYQNASLGLRFSNEKSGNTNTAGGAEVELKTNFSTTESPANCIGFIHCHLDNGKTFKVFSYSDLLAMAKVVSGSTRPTQEFAIYVVTASGTFAIKVRDRNLLINKLNLLQILSDTNERSFKREVKNSDTVEQQKLGLLKFMKNTIRDIGVDIYEKDQISGNWAKLVLNENETDVIKQNCN